MNLAKWIVLAWIALSVLLLVKNVGKTQHATTGDEAAFSVLLWGVCCWLVVIA